MYNNAKHTDADHIKYNNDPTAVNEIIKSTDQNASTDTMKRTRQTQPIHGSTQDKRL
jgi:hypothetical protein